MAGLPRVSTSGPPAAPCRCVLECPRQRLNQPPMAQEGTALEQVRLPSESSIMPQGSGCGRPRAWAASAAPGLRRRPRGSRRHCSGFRRQRGCVGTLCTGARAVLHSHQSCGRTALLVCPQDADSVWCCHAQYLILANGARGRAAVALIQQAISNPHLFHFGELIDHENIAALDGARLPFSRSCGRACAPEVQKSCFARFCASQKARRLGQGDVAPKQAVARL